MINETEAKAWIENLIDEAASYKQRYQNATQRAAALEAERDALAAELERVKNALKLLATDPITSGLSAHYRADCAGAYRDNKKRIDPLANAISVLGIDEP